MYVWESSNLLLFFRLYLLLYFDIILAFQYNYNTDIDGRMYWETELKPLHNVVPMESDWPEQESKLL